MKGKVKAPYGLRKGFFINGKGLTKTTSLGNRIAQARLNIGAKRGKFISQAELAEMVDLTGASVGNYEAGRTEPSYAILARLAKVLGVDPGWLAFGGTRLPIEEGTEEPVERPTKRLKRRKA